MISLGKIMPAGIKKINETKKQGYWDNAYTNLVNNRLPSDLKKVLLDNKCNTKYSEKNYNYMV